MSANSGASRGGRPAGSPRLRLRSVPDRHAKSMETIIMKLKWETPTARDMRFGFEITMYIANR
ncbi:hypothetical protein WQQ_25620 [Hydrocarboniphaga effusa AP103]|uniref:Coenzyme PQQ synthesis protein A n=1 Tax=Hydrocarboniphaga effusa AP103 TaxID=1172194 RepID=I8T511_9GAMM|nr:hypothetical protein WQQ_25620 [Hydrocarboniphaga effusa AP103]